MKILIVRTFPNIINPNAYNMQEIGLAKAFVRLGYDCGVVLYHGKNKDLVEHISVKDENKEKEITIYRLRGFNVLKNGIFPSLRKIAKQYDIIQVHEYDQITSWIYYAWSKRFVTIYHGPYFNSFNKGYNLKCIIFDHTFLKIKNNKNALFLTKSNAATEFLLKKGFKNVKTVGVGLDMDSFRNMEIIEHTAGKTQNRNFVWLYVGKIEPRRNCLFLFEVITDLLRKHDDMEFVIVGDGETEYKKKCFQIISDFQCSDRVKYLNKATQCELASIYQNADAMIFPSIYEIFGMVMMEAMFFGLPVISSRNGGADTLFTNMQNGILIDGFSKEEWIAKAVELYRNKALYQNICDNLIQNKEERLNWEHVARTMLNSYNGI